MPLVSVIVTTYNYSHFIRDALESVLRQSYPNFEIIVVDDGSSDIEETRRVIAELNDSRIMLIAKPVNEGISAARNTGLASVSGTYLAFLDADDLFMPHKLHTQVGLLEKNPEYVMVYSDEYLLNTDGTTDSIPVQARRSGVLPSGHIAPEFMAKSFIALFSVLLRRSVLEKTGAFDPSLPQNEDDEFWLRVMLAGPVLFSPYVSGARRVHSSNTSKNRHIMVASQCASFIKLAQQHPEFVEQNRHIIQRRIHRLAVRYVIGQIRRRTRIRFAVLNQCAVTYRTIGRTKGVI